VSSDLKANVQGESVQVDTEHPKLKGMFLAHGMFQESFRQCVDALRLVSEAEYEQNPDGDFYQKMQFALGMLDVFEELFSEKYRQELDRTKREVGNV
jgi:hypothetical protein